MGIKSKDLWEQLYGDKEFAFDFDNQLMIRKEYKTNSLFSWNKEQFDFEDEKSFIANISTIKNRDKKSIFEINNIKYFITKNPDYSYSILTPTKILDEKCPINFDLFLSNKISNYCKKEYSYILISFRKMNNDAMNIFNNYIVGYISNFKELTSFDINNNLFARTEIKFQFEINKFLNINKVLEIAITISSLMPLIIYRLSNLEIELWAEEMQEGGNFNIFVSSNNTFENIFELKNIESLGMITSFENTIFIDKRTKDIILNNGGFADSFVKAKNSATPDVYQYKLARIDIADYNQRIINKK